MRKDLCLLLIALFVIALSGCSSGTDNSPSGTQNQTTEAKTADDVPETTKSIQEDNSQYLIKLEPAEDISDLDYNGMITILKNGGIPIISDIIYDETNDTNGSSGDNTEFVEKGDFVDSRLNSSTSTGQTSGAIEIFANSQDAMTRAEYLQEYLKRDSYPTKIVFGNILIRLTGDYSLLQVDEFINILSSKNLMDQISSTKGLGVTSADIVSAIEAYGDFNPMTKYVLNDGSTVELGSNEYGTVRLFCFTPKDAEYVSAILFTVKNSNSTVYSTFENCALTATEIIDTQILEELTDYGTFEKDDYEVYAISLRSDYQYDELPIRKSEFDMDDFFKSEERCSLYVEYCKSAQYTQIQSLVNQYIEENAPRETDSAYSILNAIEPVLDSSNYLNIQYDEFEDVYNYYYGDLTQINEECNFLPWIKVSDSSSTGLTSTFNVNIGFMKSGWLFFDKFSIKLSEDSYVDKSFSYYNVNRDVIGGDTIMEWTSLSLSNDEKQSMSELDSITIRFKNSDTDEVLDHTLTQIELDGFKNLLQCYQANTRLEGYLYSWQR